MLAGLSKCDSLRTPPCFCAKAGPPADSAISNAVAAAAARRLIIISLAPSVFEYSEGISSPPRKWGSRVTAEVLEPWIPAFAGMTNSLLSFGFSFGVTLLDHLFVEPDIFHAPAVEYAIDHDCQAFDPGLLAGPAAA